MVWGFTLNSKLSIVSGFGPTVFCRIFLRRVWGLKQNTLDSLGARYARMWSDLETLAIEKIFGCTRSHSP